MAHIKHIHTYQIIDDNELHQPRRKRNRRDKDKNCTKCGQHRALVRVRGKVKHNRGCTLCFRCHRGLMDSARALTLRGEQLDRPRPTRESRKPHRAKRGGRR